MGGRSKAKKNKLFIKLSSLEAEQAQLDVIFEGAVEMPLSSARRLWDLARIIGELKAEIKLLEEEEVE